MLLYSFDSDINLFPFSSRFFYRFPMSQGLYCAEVQRWKGIMKKLSEQKNGGEKA